MYEKKSYMKMKIPIPLLLSLLLFVCTLSSVSSIDSSNCNAECTCTSTCNVCQIQNVTVLCLQGSHFEMGTNYGLVMKPELTEVLGIIKDYYIKEKGYTYDYMAMLTNYWHYRYSFSYQSFIKGMAVGAGLTLQDAKILNGMVIYGLLDDVNECPGGPPGKDAYGMLGGCAYAYVPPARSATKKGFAARNYDFPYPFYIISKYLVVTILVEPSKAPTAIISLPGQIYCQNCINSYGLFLELNNGGPSGGFCVNYYRHGLLISMLEYMQNAGAFWQLDYELRSTRADISLIVNAADASRSKSYEFTPYLGQKSFETEDDIPLVATNYFQNTTWQRTLNVSDATCWNGITRRDNIFRDIQEKPVHDLQSIKDFWVKPIERGGAVWNDTVYQIIYDTSNMNLHLRSVKHGGHWVEIPLKHIFGTVPSSVTGLQTSQHLVP